MNQSNTTTTNTQKHERKVCFRVSFRRHSTRQMYFKNSPFFIECSTEGIRTKVNSVFRFSGLQYLCQVNSSESASNTLCFAWYEGPTAIYLVDLGGNVFL